MGRATSNDLILQIYDAAVDPHTLPDCLERICESVGAQGSIIFDWDREEDFFDPKLVAVSHSNYYPDEAVRRYIEKCGQLEMQDQEQIRAATSSADKVELIDDSVFAGTPEELRALPHVIALEKIGIFHRAAGVLNKDNRWISLFTIQLGSEKPSFTDEQRDVIQPLLPHMAKALSLMKPAQQLRAQNEGFFAAMDRLSVGLCVLDKNGNVITENEEFKRQQNEYRAFYQTQNGELRFQQDGDQLAFTNLKEHALRHGHYGARPRKEAIAATREVHLCIEVVPFEKSDQFGSKAIGGTIVYSTDTSRPLVCNTLPMKHAYQLTDAELDLANAIAEGLTNGQIAERRERSISTVNTQVKSILAKTESATRTQFVRLMMSFGTSFLIDDAPEV